MLDALTDTMVFVRKYSVISGEKLFRFFQKSDCFFTVDDFHFFSTLLAFLSSKSAFSIWTIWPSTSLK